MSDKSKRGAKPRKPTEPPKGNTPTPPPTASTDAGSSSSPAVEALDETVAALESILASMSRVRDLPRDWLVEDAEKVRRAREAVEKLKAS